MPGNKIYSVIKTSMSGYWSFLKSFFSYGCLTVIFIIISAAAGSLITYPFWASAVNSPLVFTIISVSLIITAFVFALIRKFSLKNSRQLFLRKLLKLLVILRNLLLISGALYGSMVLIKKGYWYFSIPLFLITFFLLGILLYDYYKKKNTA